VSRTLITGGAGFIGAHLARRLAERGHEVDLVDSLARGQADEEIAELERSAPVRLVRGDLLDPSFLPGLSRDYDQVVHLAAIVGVANVLGGPGRTLRDNAVMVNHVLAWAATLPRLGRVLFASTSEIYAGTVSTFGLPVPTPEAVPLTVPDPADARATYALSKLYGEALCHHSGLPFTIIRPHNVYGPRMGLSHVIPELLERAHAAPDGGVLEVFSPEHRRAFCYVGDAAELIARALEGPACAGETLNVGSEGPEITMGELASLVVATVGKRLDVRPREATPGSPVRRCPDMSHTERLTGYRARVDLADGVARTYAWYRRRGFDAGGVAVR
jgi:nucleoside-diphosphate-sugar epimerase